MAPDDLDLPDLAAGEIYRKKGEIYQWFQHAERRDAAVVFREIMLNTKFGYLSAVKRRELAPAEADALLARLPSRGFVLVESADLAAAADLVARCRVETLRRLALRSGPPRPAAKEARDA